MISTRVCEEAKSTLKPSDASAEVTVSTGGRGWAMKWCFYGTVVAQKVPVWLSGGGLAIKMGGRCRRSVVSCNRTSMFHEHCPSGMRNHAPLLTHAVPLPFAETTAALCF